jgi:hypothetical protein
MRGDAVGVGDIGEVPGDERNAGDTAGGDDGGGARRERDAGVVGRHGRTEQDAAIEPRWHGVGVDDDTRIEHGSCIVYSAGERRAHGMRGDCVAVGDVGEVPGGARGSRDTADGDNDRDAGRKHDAGVVGGHTRAEQDAASEPRWHGIGVDDGTRIEHGRSGVFSPGAGGANGMRGNGVAVGDIDAVSCGAWVRRDTSGGDDGGGKESQRDAGVVRGQRRTE